VTPEPSEPLVVTAGRGTRRLTAVACRAGDDVVVTLTGGERPHVGCVVLAQPHAAGDGSARVRVTSTVVAIPPHREEALARPLAERLARTLDATVVVSAGVHDDNLSPEGIADYVRLGEGLAVALLEALAP
jgi:gallate decarboxylase subunit D